MKTPELLAPAGTLNNLEYALAYGADAVYAGMPRYSLRVRNNNFHRLENLAAGIGKTHAAGRRFYLACNVLPHNSKVRTFMDDMEEVIAMRPDALIMADPGLILMVRERWPEVAVHLSVQANTMNYAGVRFWQQQGLKRVILSRELSLEQVEEIRQQCPEMELEVFVHGALCIAYSGRCLLSGYFNHRDPNQGTCTNACRWQYDIHQGQQDACGDTVRNDDVTAGAFLLEERTRKDEMMPIEEDEHGTYILNSKDLRAVEYVEKLVQIGVDSLKIEGRTKSHYYVARATQVYRQAIDDAAAGRPFDWTLLEALENLSNRGYTSGFFQRHPDGACQNYVQGKSEGLVQQFVGEVLGERAADGMVEIDVKNKFLVGDRLELILPGGNHAFVLQGMEDKHGRPISEAPGGGHRVRIPIDISTPLVRGLLARNLEVSTPVVGRYG